MEEKKLFLRQIRVSVAAIDVPTFAYLNAPHIRAIRPHPEQ